MSEDSASLRSPIRWIPFQCPSCFGLLRVTRGDANTHGRCPSCEARLLIPSLDEIKEVLQQVKREDEVAAAPVEESVASTEIVSPEAPNYAKAEIVELTEEQKKQAAQEVVVHRKKRFIGQQVEKLDWEEEEELKDGGGVPWMMLGSVAMVFVLLAGVGVYILRNSSTSNDRPMVSGAPSLLDEARAKSHELSLQAPLEEDGTVKVIENFDEFDLEAVKLAVKGFLEAETVTERAKFVRFSEGVKPLMLNYYKGEKIEAEGLRELDLTKVSYRGDFLSSYVQLSDFTTSPIAIEKTESTYLIDWESWVGYGELTADEMSEKKPTEPVMMRVILARENYYNYSFSDDGKWLSFRLTFLNQDQALWAYVKRDSLGGKRLFASFKEGDKRPVIVSVKYLEDARAKNQVVLLNLLASGWVLDQR